MESPPLDARRNIAIRRPVMVEEDTTAQIPDEVDMGDGSIVTKDDRVMMDANMKPEEPSTPATEPAPEVKEAKEKGKLELVIELQEILIETFECKSKSFFRLWKRQR